MASEAPGCTLTTGTGNISAISETSRRIQTAQMVIDLVFIGFVVALVMARYSTLLDRSHRILPPGGSGEPSPDAIVPDHPGDQPPDGPITTATP